MTADVPLHVTADARLQDWRAIEALRAGVPNRDAVRQLGSSQRHIEEAFRERLARVKDGTAEGAQLSGLLVSGAFGTGKSHLLEYLQHLALERNFVCSRVVISKETPLYDPTKVFQAAIQGAVLPDRSGGGLTTVARKLVFDSDRYKAFFDWIHDETSGLNKRFPATLYVYQYGKDYEEYADRILQFWSGGPLNTGELRRWLRELGQLPAYPLETVSARNLAIQRYKFASGLIAAAGYTGWVLLIDEVELAGRYSLNRRAKAYAEIARFLGILEGQDIPGLTTALTITDIFASLILDEKNDEERIPGRLRTGGSDDALLLASQAERGMRAIRQATKLEPLSEEGTKNIFDRVRSVYSRAYAPWQPPPAYEVPDKTARIRQHIKTWINTWDLKRLYPAYEPTIEASQLRPTLSESPDLEVPSEGSAPSDQ